MTAIAAARLGYRSHVFSPEAGCPASHVAAQTTVAAYEDDDALAAFARAVDVVTLEFENIPYESLRRIEALTPLRPGWPVLRVSQDRRLEKDFLTDIGIATAPYAKLECEADLARALADLGCPAIIKTARLGYDGKGQRRIDSPADTAAAWRDLATDAAILERVVEFTCEVSVIVARGVDGALADYDVVENRHRHHILDTTLAPAGISAEIAREARRIARHIAEQLEIVGLLAVEMFITTEGRVLVNEIAPRPHNSGHWTLDACATDQFEQLVRAVCGLPLGSTRRHSDAVMTNLIGDAVLDWPKLLAEPGAHLHLYGKTEIRPGRKMGHVTRLSERS